MLLDGKKTAAEILNEIGVSVLELTKSGKKKPHLAAVLVGDDPPSEMYVRAKIKACAKVGFDSTFIKLPNTISEEELLNKIDELNNNNDIDGFIVQLPLPDHITKSTITLAINPAKDVDGFHPENIGKMTLGLPGLRPATPAGILELLKRNNISTEGKHCVVMGRSNIVGMPMSILLAQKASPGNCTTTICHSKTKNIVKYTRSADILIVAIGKREFITRDMVKPDTIIIDVGIHRKPANTEKGYILTGDVAFDEVSSKVDQITPVPGGVGPLTIASLLLNTLKARTKKF